MSQYTDPEQTRLFSSYKEEWLRDQHVIDENWRKRRALAIALSWIGALLFFSLFTWLMSGP